MTFTYSVGGHSVGPTGASEATVPGLGPARSYVPTVVVTPVGHAAAAVTVTGHAFSKTIAWPAGLRALASGTVGTNPNTGSVQVSFPGLPNGSFKASGMVTCGSEILPISALVANGQLTQGMNLDVMGGRCSVLVRLQDTVVPDPYGLPSANLSAAFSIGSPQSYGFTVTTGKPCTQHCSTVDYSVNYGARVSRPAPIGAFRPRPVRRVAP